MRGDELVEAGYAELGSSGNKKKRTMRGKISRTVFTNTLWYKHAYISSSMLCLTRIFLKTYNNYEGVL